MKIAIIYNRESKSVINLFGLPNRERYGLKSIQRITKALKNAGHQVIAVEGDKDLIDKLEEFMPRVLSGERPGMAFNLSYGIQGQARYTHVPGMLEMVGIPYVGSGPLAHSLSLDKVVAKMIFRQNDLPTPDFAVLDGPGFDMPDLVFPLIVKPKNEAVSFGIRIVNSEQETREAADAIFENFSQPVLIEQYIEGREINVGLLGNGPPDALPPAELSFGDGPKIYTYEDKTQRSGRIVEPVCPAKLTKKQTEHVQELAKKAFNVLGCYDCARVDLRMDGDGKMYILEVNSLPSLGEHGSYTAAAAAAGLDFPRLVNRLVDVASARYFGTPTPPQIGSRQKDVPGTVFSYLTQHRDRLERRVEEWVGVSSRSDDPVGIQLGYQKLSKSMEELNLTAVDSLSDEPSVYTWESAAGLDGGTLLLGHLDVPGSGTLSAEPFRRDPENLYGEGIGCSRAPLASLEFSLQALKSVRKLKDIPLGIMYYADEGTDAQLSDTTIEKACERAARVLVLRPGNSGDRIVSRRRGHRKYRLTVEGAPRRLGASSRGPDAMRWLYAKLEAISKLSVRGERTAVAVSDLQTMSFPLQLPHRVNVTILTSFPNAQTAASIEENIRELLSGKGPKWHLTMVSDRPAMFDRKLNKKLLTEIGKIAEVWQLPLEAEASLWPSVAGLAPTSTPVLCGLGPVAHDLYSARESVSRISLVQRSLLLTQFLLSTAKR
ncbi:MAG: ATP-grasp domain-containing protein [Gammaproteobacteria bacterium]